jgi:phosphomannomutase
MHEQSVTEFGSGLDAEMLRSKKVIVSDLDGTITDIKCDLEKNMSDAITELLRYKALAVIGGGSYGQFQNKFLAHLECPVRLLSRLYLFPTSATAFYRYENGNWQNVYLEKLSREEKEKIMQAFDFALRRAKYKRPSVVYGELIEDRETQITFAAIGQNAPPQLKRTWDPDHKKGELVKKYLEELLPEFEVNIGGATSIDVTRKGMDKAYGIHKIIECLNYTKEDLLFVGDALFKGGNDYPVKSTGIDCIGVSSPDDTMRLFSQIVEACKGK